jgi:hypothetical protein
VDFLRYRFANRVRIGPAGPDGRVAVELRGHSDATLAAEVAGFGGTVEIVDPAGVRQRLARIGADLALLYAAGVSG